MADIIPNMQGYIKGFTVPVIRPAVSALPGADGQPAGIAVGHATIEGEPHVMLTLRHPDGATLMTVLNGRALAKLASLLKDSQDDPLAQITPAATH